MKYTVEWDAGYHIMKNGEKFLSLVDDPEDWGDAEYVCDLLNNAQQSVQSDEKPVKISLIQKLLAAFRR